LTTSSQHSTHFYKTKTIRKYQQLYKTLSHTHYRNLTKLYTTLQQINNNIQYLYKTIRNSTKLYKTIHNTLHNYISSTKLYKTSKLCKKQKKQQNFRQLHTIIQHIQSFTKLHKTKTLPHFVFTRTVHKCENTLQHCTELHNIVQQKYNTLQQLHKYLQNKTLQHCTQLHNKQTLANFCRLRNKLYKTLHNSTQLYTTLHNFTKHTKLYTTLPNSTTMYNTLHKFTIVEKTLQNFKRTFTKLYNT